MALQREVYEKSSIDGFRTQRVESLALSASERRIFAGTVDGTLVAYSNCPVFDSVGSKNLIKSVISGLRLMLISCSVNALAFMCGIGHHSKAAQRQEANYKPSCCRGMESASLPTNLTLFLYGDFLL